MSIFVTMIVAVTVPMVYRFTPYAATFDPAVFGIGTSVIVFFVARFFTRGLRNNES
ncbi:hypothetical protein KQI52_05670 [bacterium]|nr:hypothetical protein [bacterium]